MKKQFNQNKINSKENKTLELLKSKFRDNNLQVIKSDKGNTVCILDNENYKEKTENFLKFNEFEEIKNLVKSFDKTVKEKRKNSIILTNKQKYSLLEKNPQCPRLYSLPKIHKSEKLEDIPNKPVVSHTN